MRILFPILFVLFFFGQNHAQSTAYVLQGGLTIGTQKWDNSFNRRPLFAYHGDLVIESVDNEDDKSSFFMQIGYHIKGSANRFRYFNINSGFPSTGVFSERFEFRNISLILGAKQKYVFGSNGARYYFSAGLRGDYTLSTNIDELPNAQFNPGAYPYIGGVRRWMAGVSIGGGLEFKFTELIGGELKISLHPDFTLQYSQPPVNNVINPYGPPGTTISIPERRIRNNTLEVSFGLRLLHKVEIVE
jgi:hypothetical protein